MRLKLVLPNPHQLKVKVKVFYLLVLLSLPGCAAQISHEKLLPGIENLRTALFIDIEFSENINQTCRNKVLQASGKPASVFTYFGACSVIVPDSELTPGMTPSCKIVLPKNDWHKALQHEILHCMGYAHK
jgi:hypothetical protein